MPSAPPQTLTCSLLAAPTNAALNSASGIFVWRPLVSQTNTTNWISVKVADNDQPVLSATNLFAVKVNPLAAPVPEPPTFALLGGALVALDAFRRFKNKLFAQDFGFRQQPLPATGNGCFIATCLTTRRGFPGYFQLMANFIAKAEWFI
jgi:hypothetical protein